MRDYSIPGAINSTGHRDRICSRKISEDCSDCIRNSECEQSTKEQKLIKRLVVVYDNGLIDIVEVGATDGVIIQKIGDKKQIICQATLNQMMQAQKIIISEMTEVDGEATMLLALQSLLNNME